MEKIIRKIFFIWDFEKEENWLNEMSAEGWQLCKVGFCIYTFEKSEIKDYIYRLQLLEKSPSHPESKKYIAFVEETEAEYVASMLNWVYFRKKAGTGGFNLFSDIDSRLKHLNRMLLLAGIASGINIYNGFNQVILGYQNYKFNFVLGIICLSLGILIGLGFLKLLSEKNKLLKEKTLHE